MTNNANKVASFKINGADISEYKIFTVDEIPEGKTLVDDINKYLGVTVSLETAKEMSNEGKYIVLDRSSYDYYDYSLTVENGNLYVKGSYRSFEKALAALIAYLDGTNGADINLTSVNNMEGKLDKIELPYNTKEELLKIYQYAYDNDLTIYGEHLAGTYDVNGFQEKFIREVGDCPAILDFDLLHHYTKGYNRSQYSKSICELFEFVSKGGIIATMCHWINPNNELRGAVFYRGKVGTREQWESLFEEGSEFNKKWKAQLTYDAEFFLALQKLGVCLSFRPIHEANQNVDFWFDSSQINYSLSSDDLKRMWNYVYDYYTKELGINNLLWTYGAIKSAHTDVSQGDPFPTDYYYPGDDRCDLMGIDWYTGNYNLSTGYGYDRIFKYGKPCGLTEFGTAGDFHNEVSREEQEKVFTCEDFIRIINMAKENGLKIAFWETYWSTFGSALWLERGEALKEADCILLLGDMSGIIKKALGK